MKRLTWLFLIAFLANHITWALPGAEAANANETLHFGRLQFYAGNYAESLDKLNKAIDGGNLSLEELATAYLLKARCEARRDKKGNAVKAFCKMYETEYPLVVAKSDFTATEMKAYREATEKCAPAPTPASQQAAPVEKQAATTPTTTPTPAPTQAQTQTQAQAQAPTDTSPVEAAPMEKTKEAAAPVQTTPVETAPVLAAAPVVAQKPGGKRWYKKPFNWIFGAGVAGLVYLLATNDSDRVLADPDAQ